MPASLISFKYNFLTIFHGKKLLTRFSQNHFYFMLCWSFLRNYWTDPYEILYTYLAHVWLLLDLGLCKIFDFYYFYQSKSHSKKLHFSKKKFQQPLFCYFCIKMNNSRLDSSHTHTEPKSFWILCVKMIFLWENIHTVAMPFLEELRRCWDF